MAQFITDNKANSFIIAERAFWKSRYSLERQQISNATTLGLEIQNTIPEEVSSVVWALKDCVSFVRHFSPGKKGKR